MISLKCSGCGSSSYKTNKVNSVNLKSVPNHLNDKGTESTPTFKGALNCSGCGSSKNKLGKNLDKNV